MALSTDEESKVREIIEAFTNGKRLSDLPDVSGNNPFNLLCEVLEDGESKKRLSQPCCQIWKKAACMELNTTQRYHRLMSLVSAICHFTNPCPFTTV